MKNLPQIMPVFPLEGVVMFPNTYLPLNIFEPRYLKMIEYSMSQKNRLIGMIQPKKTRDKDEDIDLYNVGCAGRIIKFEETEDSRYLITLKGVSRFNLLSDITNKDNFREAKVNWNEFIEDLNQAGYKDSFVSLKIVLKDFFKLVYQVLLGQEQGPRLGSIIKLYGLQETIKMIEEKVNFHK